MSLNTDRQIISNYLEWYRGVTPANIPQPVLKLTTHYSHMSNSTNTEVHFDEKDDV